jgi:dGTPase
MRKDSTALKQFLLRNLYRHPQVMETTNQARRIVRDLYAAYMETPSDMQPGFAARCEAADAEPDAMQVRARTVADFIAGMTDRFAVREHERMTGLHLLG